MSSQRSRRRSASYAAWLATILAASLLSAAFAQYPGHIDTKKKAAQTPRAIAVLEWIGQPGKPSASRMIPVSVFDGEQYQPGGLYLARPAPLAVESGTEYILQDAGIPKGLFEVNTAQDVQGYWFGYGAWKQLAVPKPHKAVQGKSMPQVVTEANSDRPHFKTRNAGSSDTSGSGSQGNSDSSTASGSSTSSHQPPPADPDRPTLRRRSDSPDSENTPSFAPSARETAVGGADPDRPHLTYEKQNPTDKEFQPTKLDNTPPDLEQMVAVSDATDREPHPFAYSWADPGDSAKMRSQMETLAQKAIAAQPATKPVAKPAPKPRTSTATAHRPRKTAPAASVLPALTDEHFKAYELTYSGGATLVFSAQSTDPAGKTIYVTLIAKPDFSGVPDVIFQSVTDDQHLDQTPRMRLVDAVDARANNRGDLLFELRSKHDRQFVLFEISGSQAQQVFTTGSLPYSTTSTG